MTFLSHLIIAWTVASSWIAKAAVTEQEMMQTLNQVASLYESSIDGLGGVVEIRARYDLPQYVANARRDVGTWMIELWGGYARDPLMTTDALALLICHEFGHHLAGPPYMTSSSYTWSSVEGQADYFAAQNCLPRYIVEFSPDLIDNNPLAETTEICLQNAEVHCSRVLRAMRDLLRVFAILQKKEPPNFLTPDPTRVTETERSHPALQCRLDTLVAGYFSAPRPACWFRD